MVVRHAYMADGIQDSARGVGETAAEKEIAYVGTYATYAYTCVTGVES